MDKEKIKELAREYAEDIFGKDDYPFKEDDMCNAEEDFESVVEFLSKTHCIVEKEKIKALYSKMELDGNHVDSDNDWAVYEAMDELEKIFGEELFNTTEK